jgi:hypothetical protein
VAEPTTRVARVCSLLNAAEARYVIVGATAMQPWGTSRATRDVDVLIEPTLDNAARVIEALAQLPFGVAADLTPEAIVPETMRRVGGNGCSSTARREAWVRMPCRSPRSTGHT